MTPEIRTIEYATGLFTISALTLAACGQATGGWRVRGNPRILEPVPRKALAGAPRRRPFALYPLRGSRAISCASIASRALRSAPGGHWWHIIIANSRRIDLYILPRCAAGPG